MKHFLGRMISLCLTCGMILSLTAPVFAENELDTNISADTKTTQVLDSEQSSTNEVSEIAPMSLQETPATFAVDNARVVFYSGNNGIFADNSSELSFESNSSIRIGVLIEGKVPTVIANEAFEFVGWEVTLDGYTILKSSNENLVDNTKGLVMYNGQVIKISALYKDKPLPVLPSKVIFTTDGNGYYNDNVSELSFVGSTEGLRLLEVVKEENIPTVKANAGFNLDGWQLIVNGKLEAIYDATKNLKDILQSYVVTAGMTVEIKAMFDIIPLQQILTTVEFRVVGNGKFTDANLTGIIKAFPFAYENQGILLSRSAYVTSKEDVLNQINPRADVGHEFTGWLFGSNSEPMSIDDLWDYMSSTYLKDGDVEVIYAVFKEKETTPLPPTPGATETPTPIETIPPGTTPVEDLPVTIEEINPVVPIVVPQPQQPVIQEPEIIVEDQTPATIAPTETITPDETPLANTRSWALINLIATIGTSLIALFYVFKNKKDEDKKKHTISKIFSIIIAVIAIILFILTEDITTRMVLIDKWTVAMVVIALVQLVFVYVAAKEKYEKTENLKRS